MSVKPFIKVPLVLLENIVFFLFPNLRTLIERYLFNPYNFDIKHNEYTKRKFSDFLQYTKNVTNLNDKTILELGPGGSMGFGLLALQNGVQRYIALEDGQHTFIQPKKVEQYKQLLENCVSSLNQYFIQTKKGVSYNPNNIRFISIDQQSRYPLPDNSVDIIYSCAVLEHVHDLDLCFSEMSRVLKSGGIMYHEVDLRDHIFSQKSLLFLKFTDFWFDILFSHTGEYVNRKRQSLYRTLARNNQLEVLSFYPTITMSESQIPKTLLKNYRNDDLAILSFITVMKK